MFSGSVLFLTPGKYYFSLLGKYGLLKLGHKLGTKVPKFKRNGESVHWKGKFSRLGASVVNC